MKSCMLPKFFSIKNYGIRIMEQNKISVLLVMVLALNACGGGSGTSSATTPMPTPTPTPTVHPSSLTLDTVVYDGCYKEKPLPGVEVVLHDSEGDIVADYQTDEQGHLDVEWPEGAMHVTVIGPNYTYLNGRTRINTTLNVSTADLGKFRYFTNEQSFGNSQNIRLDTSELNSQYKGYAFESRYSNFEIGSTSGDNITFCEGTGPLEITLYSKSESLAGWLTITDQSSIKLIPENFTEIGVPIIAALTELIDDSDIFSWSARARHPATNVYYRNSGISSEQIPTGLFTFPSSDENRKLVFFEQSNNQITEHNATLSLYEIHQLDESNDAGLFNPALLAESTSLDLIKVIDSILEKTSVSYDFSFVGESIVDVAIYLTHIDINGGLIDWNITAPVQGQIPVLKLPQSIQERFNNDAGGYCTAYLESYSGITDYDQIQLQTTIASRQSKSLLSMVDIYKGLSVDFEF
jgi:hypothetical protein